MTPFDVPVVLFTNSPAMGGMEQHVLFLAAGFVERGIRTAVVCSARPEIAPLREELTTVGAAVHTPPDRAGPLGAGRRVRELASIFRRFPGGVLHLHSTGFHGGDLVMIAGRVARMGAIVRTEHVPPQPPVTARHRLQVRWRDRLLVSRVICVSAGNRTEHIETLGRDPGKLVVVPNGIAVERFAAEDGAGVGAELGLAEGTRLVGVVGRLAEARKGIAEFLQMAALLAPDQQGAHFVIVGDGPLRPGLELLASDLGLDGRVTFLGTRPDVARIVAALHVFVMPSLWEAGPLTLLEAMAAGKAIVTTRVGVVPEAVTHERNGLIVPAADTQALAEAVRRLLDDNELAAALGAAAAADAAREFSADRMVERTLDVYRSIVGTP